MHFGLNQLSLAWLGASGVPAPAFDPASLFSSGEVGVWLSPSDLSTVWIDDGITPATTSQAVARIDDKSGNSKHAKQIADATKRPILAVDSDGFYCLQADGLNDCLQTAAINFTGTDAITIFAAVYKQDDDTAGVLAELSASSPSNAGTFYLVNQDADGRKWAAMGRGTAAATAPLCSYDLTRAPDTAILTITHDISSDLSTMRRNGIDQLSGTGDKGSGNFGNHVLNILARNNGASVPFTGLLYELIVVGRACTPTEIVGVEAYMASKSPALLYLSRYSDSAAPVSRGGYFETSPFATAVFSTSATSVDVYTYNNIYSSFPANAEIAVYVNGIFNQRIVLTADGYSTNTITLPSGGKQVTFVNSGQSKPAASVLGAFVRRVTGNAAVTQVFPTPSNRVLVYGDSIASGATATHGTDEAWVQLLRNEHYPNSTAVEAWGYRSLFDDCSTAPLRAAFVAKLASYAPSRIWLAIGTNDYGLNKWSAASFGTAYASLLDDLHAALPSAAIYCQTPLLRSTETANASGSTLGDYRSSISSAVSTRTSYATLVDGTTILSIGDLVDGLHPNTAGHSIYSAAVISALGI